MIQNLWHDISPGKNAPQQVNAIIEIPKDSLAKYEIDKETGLLKLDRVLHTPMRYPSNYGFIPKTFCEDGDPLDILVYSQITFDPLCLVETKPIGVIRMLDGGEADDKIIAVAKGDMSVSEMDELVDLPEYLLKEVRLFFEDYKKLEGKTVEVLSVEGKEVALKTIEEAVELYGSKFGDKQ
jgi:inorganic pyrophosphatase